MSGITLITGSNGFLGSGIVRQALAGGLRIRASDIGAKSISSAVDYRQADLLDPAGLAGGLAGGETVIHAAGLAHVFGRTADSDARFDTVNRVGTGNTVRLAAEAGARRVVVFSSVSVYGESGRHGCAENAPCRPERPYALSKWRAARDAAEIARSHKLDMVILRLATLYGEGDPGNVGRLMRAIDRRRFVWLGNGSNRKRLVLRGDAATACLGAGRHITAGR